MAVIDGALYVCHRSGVSVFDVRVPDELTPVGEIRVPGQPVDVVSFSSLVLVAAGEAGLLALDPVVLSSATPAEGPIDVFLPRSQR
jgi:hypothetical protein